MDISIGGDCSSVAGVDHASGEHSGGESRREEQKEEDRRKVWKSHIAHTTLRHRDAQHALHCGGIFFASNRATPHALYPSHTDKATPRRPPMLS